MGKTQWEKAILLAKAELIMDQLSRSVTTPKSILDHERILVRERQLQVESDPEAQKFLSMAREAVANRAAVEKMIELTIFGQLKTAVKDLTHLLAGELIVAEWDPYPFKNEEDNLAWNRVAEGLKTHEPVTVLESLWVILAGIEGEM